MEDFAIPSMQEAGQWLFHATRRMFYIVTPWEVAFGEGDSPPTFLYLNGLPMFFVFMLLEALILAMRKRWSGAKHAVTYRTNDMFVGLLSGTMQVRPSSTCMI